MFESVSVGTRAAKGAIVVVPQFQDGGVESAAGGADARGLGLLAKQRADATGDLGAVVEIANAGRRFLVVGLGKRADFKLANFRDVGAAVGRRLAALKATDVEFELGAGVTAAGTSSEEAGRALGEALGILSWKFDMFRGSAAGKVNRSKLSVYSTDQRFMSGMRTGLSLAQSVNIARDLSQTPPNVATPAYMAKAARDIARKHGLKCTVMEGAALDRERMVGLKTVGAASENKPCLIRLEYTPKGSRGAKPLVLIGKTMCYDSGGLSLKVNNGMVGMKRDKDGGCAVLGAMHAVATVIRPNVPVVALLVAAENSVSDEAYRPDDVMTYRNGVTVEVTNTDAEGRLVLADALCWACEKENPRAVIDLATLTGGVVVALGKVFAGYWCEDSDWRERLEAASARSGEGIWRLPHHADYRAMMKSPVADIVNSAPVREAHPIQGAAFLSYFVTEGIPWAHIDIAGVHVSDKDRGMFIAGPTGWGVRILASLIESIRDEGGSRTRRAGTKRSAARGSTKRSSKKTVRKTGKKSGKKTGKKGGKKTARRARARAS